MDEKTPWPLRLFNKSLKKKQKWKLIEQHLPVEDDGVYLDLGCAKGVISYLMKSQGGEWAHCDLDIANLTETLKLVEKNVVQVEPNRFPFADQSLDGAVSLDFLEHIEDDAYGLAELHRIIKPGGWLIISTPRSAKGLVLNKLKPKLGLTLDKYGHLREGYSEEKLKGMLIKAGFEVYMSISYSRFFTEAIETAINLFYVHKSRRSKSLEARRDGAITIGSEQEMQRYEKLFKLYSAIYPLSRAIAAFDLLLRFTKGYALFILAYKKMK